MTALVQGSLFRDPNIGAPGLIGEFLTEAQGEDVVSGRFTPVDLECEEQGLDS